MTLDRFGLSLAGSHCTLSPWLLLVCTRIATESSIESLAQLGFFAAMAAIGARHLVLDSRRISIGPGRP